MKIVIMAVLIGALAMVAGYSLYELYLSPRAYGHRLAEQMLARRSASSPFVDVSFLGPTVCFVPEGVYAPAYLNTFFPKVPLSSIPNIVDSEGVWFLFVENPPGSVRLFSIPQSSLAWHPDANSATSNVAGCGTNAQISIVGGKSIIAPIIDRSIEQIKLESK
jgi:hypothetical protein